jgi:hypothetical protein
MIYGIICLRQAVVRRGFPLKVSTFNEGFAKVRPLGGIVIYFLIKQKALLHCYKISCRYVLFTFE